LIEIEEWLAARRPPPPPDLGSSLRSTGAKSSPERTVAAALTASAGDLLDQARARPGRVRESAFRLLEADALLTYACEAALEAEDPEAVLLRILVATGT
jgi:hypothetical protein